jgi:hypothetical protein
MVHPGDKYSTCSHDCILSGVFDFIREWLGDGSEIQEVFCTNNVLSLIGDVKATCRVTDEIWTATLVLILDTIVQSGGRSGTLTQDLSARAESISTGWWWLQGVIPFCTLLLYVVCFAFTVFTTQGHERLRELNLVEVVAATHTEEFQAIAQKEGIDGGEKVGGVDGFTGERHA